MRPCSAWYLYWGHILNIPEREALHTRLGKLDDLIACHYIAAGAEPLQHAGAYDEDVIPPDVL